MNRPDRHESGVEPTEVGTEQRRQTNVAVAHATAAGEVHDAHERQGDRRRRAASSRSVRLVPDERRDAQQRDADRRGDVDDLCVAGASSCRSIQLSPTSPTASVQYAGSAQSRPNFHANIPNSKLGDQLKNQRFHADICTTAATFASQCEPTEHRNQIYGNQGRRPQFPHAEPGETIEAPRGTRSTTTVRNEPNRRPYAAAMAIVMSTQSHSSGRRATREASPMFNPDPTLVTLLQATVAAGASDLHLSVGRPPTARRDGVPRAVRRCRRPRRRATPSASCSRCCRTSSASELDEVQQVDFSFGLEGLGRFRANAFKQRNTYALGPSRRALPSSLARGARRAVRRAPTCSTSRTVSFSSWARPAPVRARPWRR